MPSQCILGRTLGKKQMMMSVSTKVAMQLDCKLGGELWALEVPVGGGLGCGLGGGLGGRLGGGLGGGLGGDCSAAGWWVG